MQTTPWKRWRNKVLLWHPVLLYLTIFLCPGSAHGSLSIFRPVVMSSCRSCATVSHNADCLSLTFTRADKLTEVPTAYYTKVTEDELTVLLPTRCNAWLTVLQMKKKKYFFYEYLFPSSSIHSVIHSFILFHFIFLFLSPSSLSPFFLPPTFYITLRN